MKRLNVNLTRRQKLLRDGLILLAALLFWAAAAGFPYLTPRGALWGAEDRALLSHSKYADSWNGGLEIAGGGLERLALGVGEGEVHYAWLERRWRLFWTPLSGAGVLPLETGLRAHNVYLGGTGYQLVRSGDGQSDPVARDAALELVCLMTAADPQVAAVEVTAAVTLDWLDADKEIAERQDLSLTVRAQPVSDGIWLAHVLFSQGYDEGRKGLEPSFSGAEPQVRVAALDARGGVLYEREADW